MDQTGSICTRCFPRGVFLGRRREDEHNPLIWGKHRRKNVMLMSDERKWERG